MDQNLEATERRADMARVSHFVQLKNFNRTASPRLRKAVQVGQVQTGGHDDKMVNIDLSGDIKEREDYNIVRTGANPGGMISAGALDCH